MESTAFISLIHRHTNLSQKDVDELRSLAEEYPYSQVIHVLLARGTKDTDDAQHQQALQIAAVHSADRSVLRELMERTDDSAQSDISNNDTEEITIETVAPSLELKEKEPLTDVIEPVKTEIEVTETKTISIISTLEGHDVADQVMKDLDRLNTLKHNFEMLFVEYSEVEATGPAPEKQAETKVEKPETEKPKLKGKSKKARIIELAKEMKAVDPEATRPAPVKKKKPKAKDESDELIEEIESKREIELDSEKQKEQIELIDQFIKASPSISNAKDRQQIVVGDLNPIKSGEFTDNIISETLVEILVKQGKKDKAIEVLKKLIWKYPQKKTYFASQIEELKK